MSALRVACIVWWDYFGGQPVPHRWDHLDGYLKKPFVPMRNCLIEEGLIIAGYTVARAKSRGSPRVSTIADEANGVVKKLYGPHKNLFKRKAHTPHNNHA